MTYWPRTTDPYAPPPSTAASAWPLWTVTTDTGWQRVTPRMRLRLRKCRRLRIGKGLEGCACGHPWPMHGPEAPGCVECECEYIREGVTK